MIESITLGSLTLVGERVGPLVRIRTAGYDSFTTATADEWSSLLALADTKLAGEREVERLRAELGALREANQKLADTAEVFAESHYAAGYYATRQECDDALEFIKQLKKASQP